MESARIRLSRFKLAPDIALSETDDGPSACIRWDDARPASSDPLDGWLEARHSNRHLVFKGPGLADDQRARFEADAQEVAGSAMSWLDGADRRRAAGSLMQAAEQARFARRELHAELYGAIRFDVGWHQTCDSGIAPGSLGVLLPERLGFKALRAWSWQRAANWLGTHRVLGLRSAGLPARFAPHLVAVGGGGEQLSDFVAAGRLLQRLWTRSAMEGMAAQVMAAAPLYALAGASWVDIKLGQQLAGGWKLLCPNYTPMVILRIGRAPIPPVRTGRAAPTIIAN